ncbi:polyglutamine-binding protein 1 isoform X2 [Hermetia illucens]|uniref:polyglutamine-binding protein 1 isoform X2 n=1 Tax=Hermetia illucens TaxID=343691 RepID=UPI0018CC1F18|nr:polyglutamine-binding protein 1 isoform X2 [Hermetia illucens]
MPLPPALRKRLANRGIVQGSTGSKNSAENEEIIAEDYDEVEDPLQYDFEPVKKPSSNFWIERMKRRIGDTNVSGYKGCPNKYNIFHKCTLYCINKWGDGILEPKRSYLRRRNRLLRKYPLPKNWLEVYDYGCAVYYYWNTTDDTVSWLPPGHPKAYISKSAAVLRHELDEAIPIEMEDDGGEQMTLDIQKLLDESLPPPHKRLPSPEPKPPKKSKPRDLDKALRHKHSRRVRMSRPGDTDSLDPMDPASYSDIPRGKWSDGLLDGGGAKSGSDPTASGALFQMRPYPSPGAVLQRNSAAGGTDRKTAKHSPARND